jgi:hypothetical protein
MKVIISPLYAFDHYVSREFAFIMRNLIQSYGWKHVEVVDLQSRPGSLSDKLKQEFGELPQVILVWGASWFISENAEQIESLDCVKALLADDPHWGPDDEPRWGQCLTYMIVDLVFATYGYALHDFYPEARNFSRCIWLPHSASPDFFLPFNPQAENTLLLSGATSRVYPLRELVKALCDSGNYRIFHHPHPGYGTDYDNDGDPRVGQGYGRLINRFRAAFTDCSIYRYAVAKHFEIPATGALLLADRAIAGPLLDLGFVDGEHYITASDDDLEDRVRYILDEANHDEIDAVRRRAQALVWERHKTSDRAALIDEVCKATR